MKRMYLLLGICCCYFSAAIAQSIDPGVELGANFSNLHTRVNGIDGNSQSRSGVKIGGFVDIGLWHNLSIQPGLFYIVKGARQDYITSTQDENGIITTHEVSDLYRLNYLEIPVNFQYKFNGRRYGYFFAGAGPYIAFALNGKVTTDDVTTIDRPNGFTTITDRVTEYNLRIGNNANTDDIKAGDMGINLNGGFQFPSGLLLRGNIGLGIMNIMPGGDNENFMRNNSVAISVGYLFR
jgi:hypothetical protein